MKKQFIFFLLWSFIAITHLLPEARAEVPFPMAPDGTNVYKYEQYCFLKSEQDLPANYQGDSVWKYSSKPSGNKVIDGNPRELHGVTGMSVDKAWEITTGRPDVTIAVIDSGVIWDLPYLNNKFYLNKGELPKPENSDDYDKNLDGVFNMEDYADDQRLTDWNENGLIDPEDLIHAVDGNGTPFSNGIDDDGNGYIDDICGWDMVDDDNDPFDDVDYGHGTGESADSCAEAYTASTDGFPGTCPNCMILPIRVGLSFMAEDMNFGRSVIFAVDSGADVVQEALGTISNSSLAQKAIAYAYFNNVPIMASAADESSLHQNFPAAHEHTITLNSVTKFNEGMSPESYLYLNGCTNYGGNMDASVSSSSCSSEAVGRGAGIAGLLISAAKNQMAKGKLDRKLTANEIKQIITMGADDIDFSGNYMTSLSLFKTRRFESGPGWDQYFGYGRVNTEKAVKMVADGNIPPEADIALPLWFETLDPLTTPSVDITGYVAARRAKTYSYNIEAGRGIQPARWKTIVTYEALHSPKEGLLGTWDIAEFLDEVSYPPTDPNDFTFTIRLVAWDNNGLLAESRKTVYLHHDPQLKAGFPKKLSSSGEAAVVMADLDGDNIEDMIVSTTDGFIYALHGDGTPLAGWPVHTSLLTEAYNNSEAYTSKAIDNTIYESIGFGGVAVGDIDKDGDLEVVAASLYGRVYVWEHDGTIRAGFPVSLNPKFSLNPAATDKPQNNARDKYNRRLFGVASAPVLEDMNMDGTLEIICSALDNHVYVWEEDGSLLTGWPVLVIDRDRFDVEDTISNKLIPSDDDSYYTGKIVSTPAVGDIDNDGLPEIVVGTNEQYDEHMNVSLSAGLLGLVGKLDAIGGNARLHALNYDGTVVEGEWPVKIALLMPEMLPYVGSGLPGAPALADVDKDGTLEIATFSMGGPVYLLNGDGSSFYGSDFSGDYHVMDLGPLISTGTDLPTIPAAGSPIFADLTGTGNLNVIAPSAGLNKMQDITLPANQVNAENHISAWNALDGKMLENFPAYMDDLQFFASPTIADLDSDGQPELIEGSGGFLLRAYNANGEMPDTWPKFTGQWITSAPGVGDIDGDGLIEIAVMTRSGYLYVWDTIAVACDNCNREWKTFHHDARHTGLYGKDVISPSRPLDFYAKAKDGNLNFTFSTSGDDGICGQATEYEIRGYVGDIKKGWGNPEFVKTFTGSTLALAGNQIKLTIADKGYDYVGIQATDDAGNLSLPVLTLVEVEYTPHNQQPIINSGWQPEDDSSGFCFISEISVLR